MAIRLVPIVFPLGMKEPARIRFQIRSFCRDLLAGIKKPADTVFEDFFMYYFSGVSASHPMNPGTRRDARAEVNEQT